MYCTLSLSIRTSKLFVRSKRTRQGLRARVGRARTVRDVVPSNANATCLSYRNLALNCQARSQMLAYAPSRLLIRSLLCFEHFATPKRPLTFLC